jgi:hypothetical protein
MARFLRPLTLYVLTTILYLLAVTSNGVTSTAAATAGHALALATVLLAVHRRRRRQARSGPPFTRTRAWRAFKLFYCIAIPPLVFLAVKTYQDAQPNPYEHIDASGDVAAQMKEAHETFELIFKETAPVVQSMWLGLPLVAVGLFYAIRGGIVYIIGRPDDQSVHSRAA